MRLVKVQSLNLKPGMFVAELDRPWLDTPFAIQGFVIRDAADVDQVAQFVEHVFVDSDYTGGARFLVLDSSEEKEKRGGILELKADFQAARVSFESASDSLSKVFESLRGGRHADISAVQEAVSPLIEGIFRNQEAVAALLRLKDSGDYRYQHGISMALWGVILGRQIGLHRQELEKLAVGCAMCDVGMTELPQKLLDQRESLDEKQRMIIERHTVMGAEMVADSQHVDFEILSIIENHHERVDGSGYPRGLEGSQIPLLAKIAGLVDAYDAMVSARAYAPARTSHEAAQELMDRQGELFQTSLVEQFIQAIGLFPTGVIVELNTAEVAIVIRQNEMRRLKPEIVVVLDKDKERKEHLEVVELARQQVGLDGERWIARELLPGTYGINSQEFFI
ncbi:MAG: HD-GYP domain-containing protein (c-di-GMP phosphodiesterase class II) [Halieaceae bacterium]|jgi:HD-GYP domain-containing protein (c-di-GMP phosphodiesterase class II)